MLQASGCSLPAGSVVYSSLGAVLFYWSLQTRQEKAVGRRWSHIVQLQVTPHNRTEEFFFRSVFRTHHRWSFMSRPLDLFGKPVARRGAIYHSPKNRYENVVNALAACHPSLPPVDVKRKADDAWRETGKGENDAKVEKMLSAAASLEEKDKRLVRTSFVVGHDRENRAKHNRPQAFLIRLSSRPLSRRRLKI